jgi:hypothetical protein
MSQLVALMHSNAALLPCLARALGGDMDLEAGTGKTLGVGSFDNGQVLLRKRPAQGPADLGGLAAGIFSEVFVAVSHRNGPRGFSEEDTSPHRLRNWLFAGTGRVLPVGERAVVAASLPEFLQRGLDAASDAELAFRVALGHVHAASRRLEHPDLEPSIVAAAMARTLGQLDRRAREAGVAPPRTASVLTNGRLLVAVRSGRPLSYRLVEGLATCARCEIGPLTPETDPRVRPHRTLKGVVVASRVVGGRWLEVSEGSALTVGRDYAVTVAPLASPAGA